MYIYNIYNIYRPNKDPGHQHHTRAGKHAMGARHDTTLLQAGDGTRGAHLHIPLGEARSQNLQVAHYGACGFRSQLEPVRPRRRRGHFRQVRRGSEQGRCVRCRKEKRH